MTKDPWRSSQLCLYMRTLQQAPADVLAKLLPSCTTCSHIHSDLLCLSTQSKMFVSLQLLRQARSNFLPPKLHLCQCIARGKAFFVFLEDGSPPRGILFAGFDPKNLQGICIAWLMSGSWLSGYHLMAKIFDSLVQVC